MCLERKDIRAKLSADLHAKLKAICELDGIEMSDWVEQVIVPVIEKRAHDAIELAQRLQRLGFAGTEKPAPGKSGSRRE